MMNSFSRSSSKARENGVEFDIFGKDSCTLRNIYIDSSICSKQEILSLNFLFQRLCNCPLTNESFQKERVYIKKLADATDVDTVILLGK